MKATIEHTDLYADTANYSWCRRASIKCDELTDLQIIRRLKKLVDLSGVKARLVAESGDYKQYNISATECFFIIYEY